jgi:hypothetical protein
LNGITSNQNFIKIYQAVQKLLGGIDRQTDRDTGDLINLLSFWESRVKMRNVIMPFYTKINAQLLQQMIATLRGKIKFL